MLKEFSFLLTNNPSFGILKADSSNLPESISLSDPHLFDLEEIEIGGKTLFLLNSILRIQPTSFLKTIESVKIFVVEANYTKNFNEHDSPYYIWKSVNTNTIPIDINCVIYFPPEPGNYKIIASYTYRNLLQTESLYLELPILVLD